MQMPSLPTISSVSRRLGLSRGKSDAILLLEKDHRAFEALFARFKKAKSSRDKGRIAERICRELKVHVEIEEKVFYPAVRKALDDEVMIDEALVEHAHQKELVRDLEARSPGEDMYDADMKVLMDYVKHHVKEEERDMFPEVRATEMDMEKVGAKMAARKKLIMQRVKGKGAARHKANGKAKTRPSPKRRARKTRRNS